MSRFTLAAITPWLLSFCLVCPLAAQEHPEHPEHPEHGAGSGTTEVKLTKEDLARAIEDHVKAKSEDGVFKVQDEVSGKTLDFKLDLVHEERLSQVGPDRYFACADFKADDGTVYDVDFFMEGKDKGSLQFSDLSIHKVNGEPRYSWYEEGGVWKKREGSEAPEAEEGDGSSEHQGRRGGS